MEDIEHYDIPVYNFPYDVEEDDEETIQDNSELRVRSLLKMLTPSQSKSNIGTPSFCDHRFRGRDRNRWTTCSSEDISVGHCRGRQPQALRFQQVEERLAKVTLSSSECSTIVKIFF